METDITPIAPANSSRELETQKKRLRESCREFESLMISYLMKTMRDTVSRAEEPEHAREVYEDMLSGQVSKELGRTSVFGLGDLLYAKLKTTLGTRRPGAKPETEAPVQAASEAPPEILVKKQAPFADK